MGKSLLNLVEALGKGVAWSFHVPPRAGRATRRRHRVGYREERETWRGRP